MSEKEKDEPKPAGGIQKFQRVRNMLSEMEKTEKFQKKVISACSTHPSMIQEKRLELQRKIFKIERLIRDIQTGKLSKEEESEAFVLVNLYGLVAQLEASALQIDTLTKRNLLIRRVNGVAKEFHGAKVETVASMLQAVASFSGETSRNTELAAEMLHDAAVKANPQVFAGTVKDDNGVESDKDDIYKLALEEEDDSEITDEEPIEIDEEAAEQEMAEITDLAEAAKAKVKLRKEQASGK